MRHGELERAGSKQKAGAAPGRRSEKVARSSEALFCPQLAISKFGGGGTIVQVRMCSWNLVGDSSPDVCNPLRPLILQVAIIMLKREGVRGEAFARGGSHCLCTPYFCDPFN